MTRLPKWTEWRARAVAEWRHLVAVNPSARPWQMPVAAALAAGLPLMVGAWFGHMDFGLVSSLGGLVFLFLPNTALHHRMVTLMACSFGMIACYTLGVMAHFLPLLMMPALMFIAALATMVSRFYRLPPPGSFFFIMAAAIAIHAPVEVDDVPLRVGLVTMGALLACLIAFFYSLYLLRLQPAEPVAALPPATFDFVIFDSVVIGVFLGLALGLAQALQMERAYWVPVSCLAVVQGATLRAVWTRQAHRVVGTGLGLLLTWALLLLPLDTWGVSLLMMALAFIIETLVVRHYGLATVFITPMAIFLAEAASLGHGSPTALIEARFYDTLLGSTVGFVGGVCLHSPRFRAIVGGQLRRLIPSRLAIRD